MEDLLGKPHTFAGDPNFSPLCRFPLQEPLLLVHQISPENPRDVGLSVSPQNRIVIRTGSRIATTAFGSRSRI